MDFKIAGTKKGITAVQLDMKLPGIPLGILVEALEPALAGRTHILNAMETILIKPREDLRENIPRRGEDCRRHTSSTSEDLEIFFRVTCLVKSHFSLLSFPFPFPSHFHFYFHDKVEDDG